MPYNGAGTFVRLHNWVTDKINGLNIIASRVDAEMDGMAAGLSNTITRDGQSIVVAPIPFNGKRLMEVGDPVADTDAMNKRTFAAGSFPSSVTVGGRLIVGAGQTSATIDLDDTDNGKRYVHNNDGYVGFLHSGFNWSFRVQDNGDWHSPYGGGTSLSGIVSTLNGKAGSGYNEFSGAQVIRQAYGAFRTVYPGVRDWGFQTRENGWAYLFDFTGNAYGLAVDLDGAIWSRQLGGRISDWVSNNFEPIGSEGRANAYTNGRVAKSGDTMTGDLQISKANPRIEFLWSGVYRVDWLLGGDGRMYMRNVDSGAARMSVGPGGDIITAQVGDWYNHVENRAAAFADNRKNGLVADVTLSNAYFDMIRGGGGISEYAPGWVATGLGILGDGQDYMRLRAIQKTYGDGNRYVIGFAG